MLEQPEIAHLVNTELIAPPGLRSLEVTSRALLVAAALEHARYGSGSDRLLQLYRRRADSTRAEYKKILDPSGARFERLVVDLSKRTLILALEQGVPDPSGHSPNVFVDKAVITTMGSSRTGSVNERELVREPFNTTAIHQYTNALHEQIEGLELELPPISLFTEK